MTDAVRELFEMLAKKEKSGSDYTGRVTRVEGGTAYVQFDGSDIPNTPVALSIGAKAGDEVRIRVADGKAWIVGNDTNPPTDDSAAQEVAEEMVDMRTRVTGLQGQYTEIQRTADNISTIVSDGDKLVSVINQTADEVQISANKINLSGYVTIASLESTDTTTINGGAIAAKSFTAKYNNSTDSADVTLNTNGLSVYHKYSNKDYRSDVKPGELYLYIQGSGSSTINATSWSVWNSAVANGTTVSPDNVKVETADTYARMYGSSFECNHSTTGRTGRFVSSAAGNVGLYDASEGNYIIYSASDFKVHVPHQFLCCGADESSTTQRVPVGSSNVADQGVQWLGGTGTNTLAINAEWNSGSFETKTIAVSSSDIRLKDNVTDTDVNALEFINRIKLHAFDWKWTKAHQNIGVIADELEQLDPSLVVGGGTDKEGNPIYKSINNLVLISYLTKAVQELSTKVEELENKLSTMEDKNHGHS